MILIFRSCNLVRVINGKIIKNMKIKMISTNQEYIVEKVGVFTPKAKDINELKFR